MTKRNPTVIQQFIYVLPFPGSRRLGPSPHMSRVPLGESVLTFALHLRPTWTRLAFLVAPNGADRGFAQGLATLGRRAFPLCSGDFRGDLRAKWIASTLKRTDETHLVAAATVARCDHQEQWVLVAISSLSAPSFVTTVSCLFVGSIFGSVRCQGNILSFVRRIWAHGVDSRRAEHGHSEALRGTTGQKTLSSTIENIVRVGLERSLYCS